MEILYNQNRGTATTFYRLFYFRLSNIWSQIKRIRSFHQIKVKTLAAIKVMGVDFGIFKSKSKLESQIE